MAQNLPDIWSNLNWPIVHSHLNTTPQFRPSISGQLIAVSSNFNFHSVFMWAEHSTGLPQVLSAVKELVEGPLQDVELTCDRVEWSGG